MREHKQTNLGSSNSGGQGFFSYAKYPLLFICMLTLAFTAFAAHNPTAKLEPEWSQGNATVNYRVTLSSQAGNDDIDEVRIIKSPGYTNFDCEAKTGWHLIHVDPWFDPEFPGELTELCWYYTTDPNNNIPGGGSDNFEFSATVPGDEGCNFKWKFETRDEVSPTYGEWEITYDYTNIDSTDPLINKSMEGPEYGDCPPGGDCWVNKQTVITVCSEDQGDDECIGTEPYAANTKSGVAYCDFEIKLDGSPYQSWRVNDNKAGDNNEDEGEICTDVQFTEDSEHELKVTCYDKAGNNVEDIEAFLVESQAPETTKVITPEAYYGPCPQLPPSCGGYQPQATCEWLGPNHQIALNAVDPDPHPSGVKETLYANEIIDDGCWNGCWDPNQCHRDPKELQWQPYTGPFTKDTECCHLLAWYSVDNLEQQEEINYQCFFVDLTPPEITKTVGTPKVPGQGFDYWITQNTPIEIHCEDVGEHPSDNVTIYWSYTVDGSPAVTGSHNGEDYTLYFPGDSEHVLDVWCIDAVGNRTDHETETFKVDSLPPEISKTMLGDYLGACPPQNPSDECYVADNGTSGVRISATDAPGICVVDEVYCTYELYWEDQPGSPIAMGMFDGATGTDVLFTEDSKHTLVVTCWDALENETVDEEDFLVDSTPPETKKTYGDPNKTEPDCLDRCISMCIGAQEGCVEACTHHDCTIWITSDTQITLEAEDEKVGVDKIYWKNTLVDDSQCWDVTGCQPESCPGCPDWTEYTGPFTKGEESCHKIEYYAVDLLGNTEEVKAQCVFVDNTAPEGIKTVGDPNIPCEPGQPGSEYCDGTPTSCDPYVEAQCLAIPGCDWVSDPGSSTCAGIPGPEACSVYNEDQCGFILGCDWSTGAGYYACEGAPAPESCNAYSIEQCGMIPNCYWCDITDMCWSTPVSCDTVASAWPQDPEGKCLETAGCDWVYHEEPSYCYGTPILSCSEIQNQGVAHGYNDKCAETPGCYWDTVPGNEYCTGVPTSCEAVAANWPIDPAAKCDETPGCGWVVDPGTGPECDYWVRDPTVAEPTLITLDCEDQGNHPVEQETMCYRVSFDEEPDGYITDEYCAQFGGQMTGAAPEDWCCAYVGDEPTHAVAYELYFMEDSLHDLEFYCTDHLGNAEQETDYELFKVDSVPPTTTKAYVPDAYIDPTTGWEYIDTVHEIELTAVDGGAVCAIGVGEVQYRVSGALGDIFCEKCANWMSMMRPDMGPWNAYTGPFGIAEESCHVIEYRSLDLLENPEEIKWQCVFVDKTPPEITKEYEEGDPYFSEEGKEWITSETDILISAVDPEPHSSGLASLEYRISLVADMYCEDQVVCQEAVGSGNFADVAGPVRIGEESCHLIEIRAEDNVGKTSEHKQCVLVDNTPPTPEKTVGEPKTEWDGLDSIYYDLEQFCTEPGKCWKVTLLTPIKLNCVDPQPHPVDHEIVCFYVEVDAEDETSGYCLQMGGTMNAEDGYCCLEGTTDQFFFLEETEHNLKYYCEDALGNIGPVDDEKFKVTGTTFEIELNKKWNLISVPYVLLDPSIDEVLKEVEENVEGVWTYDAFTDQWYVYRPNSPATSNLADMQPGWGYWVAMLEEDLLTIGGSLFSPVTTPPSRELKGGWNIIGYYGADDGEDPPTTIMQYDGPDGEGKMAHCALWSLGSTVWDKGWTALFTYWEPDNPNQWKLLSKEDGMDPGAGYWVSIPEDYTYNVTTSCGFLIDLMGL